VSSRGRRGGRGTSQYTGDHAIHPVCPATYRKVLHFVQDDKDSGHESMISLLIATRNSHKTQEFRKILEPDFDVHDLAAHPEIPEIIESGSTFAENAALKAVAVSKRCEEIVLGDDSGLEVDLLDSAPGIFSARYSGEKATAQQNIEKLLREIVEATSRRFSSRKRPEAASTSARFRCFLALARQAELLAIFEGVVEGKIIESPRGSGGFGYDPIFVPNGFDQTFAELPEETKNQISHRARAVNQMKQSGVVDIKERRFPDRHLG
jgi:XTP/dITP diphosphohydrolase